MYEVKGNNQRPSHVYSPYGYRPTESASLNILGFNGERSDSVTGHYLLGNGYRALNTVLMRFNSPDSFSPFGEGGLNAYAYGQGDPINSYDPTGHIGLKILFRSISKLVLKRRNINSADDWINNVYYKTPHHMRPKFEQRTPNAGVQIQRTQSLPDLSIKSAENTGYNDLIGYHGSHPINTQSLLAGINPAKTKIGYYGKGFYSTPTYERTVAHGSKRFGVYVNNHKALKEGRDYSFHTSREGNYVELVLRSPAFESAKIREVTTKSTVILPRPHEAPY